MTGKQARDRAELDGHRWLYGSACEARSVVCTGRCQVLHHILPRSRGGSNGRGNLLAICDACHRWIHANPILSRQHGWTKQTEHHHEEET